jgi:hypothetical protein
MSSEAAVTLFRATRPFFGEFLPKGTPAFFGIDKRINPFDTTAHYLNRGSPVLLADRNWRTVSKEAEDFGIDEIYQDKRN